MAKRRPRLVVHLASLGFFPNYDCEIVEIEASAVRLSRKKADSVDLLLPAVETGFARINAQLRGLRRTLRTRMSELEAADRHIARLEEKVLKLKQAKRDLKQLKAEKQALRKSPERKVGQVFLAPYRLAAKTHPRNAQAIWASGHAQRSGSFAKQISGMAGDNGDPQNKTSRLPATKPALLPFAR